MAWAISLLLGELNRTDRNIVEKFFQTDTMRIERF